MSLLDLGLQPFDLLEMESFLLTAPRLQISELSLDGEKLILDSLGFGETSSDGGVPGKESETIRELDVIEKDEGKRPKARLSLICSSATF